MEGSNSQNTLKPEDDERDSFLKTQKNSAKIAFSATFLLILAIIYTLYFGRQLLIPIVIAILLSFLFTPIMRVLIKIHIPNFLAALLIIFVLFIAIGYGFDRLSDPINEWVANAPTNFPQATIKFNQITHPINQYVQRFFKIQQQIEQSANIVKSRKSIPEVSLKENNWFNTIFSSTWRFCIQLGIVIILLYFLLASHEFILHKLVRIFPYYSKKKESVLIIREVERKISYFLLIKILVAIGLAMVMGLVLLLLGMPHPFVWGILAGVLEFIPYVGVLVGTILITFSALLTFYSLGHILLVGLVFFMICFIAGNIILPLFLNRSLFLDPLVILFGIIVFGWIWGIIGALIAVPLISIFKIICDHIKPMNAYGQFLGIDSNE